jgi:hypothetical protein
MSVKWNVCGDTNFCSARVSPSLRDELDSTLLGCPAVTAKISARTVNRAVPIEKTNPLVWSTVDFVTNGTERGGRYRCWNKPIGQWQIGRVLTLIPSAKRHPFISPVPGGVGPMTVTMVLVNTITSAERAADRRHRRDDCSQSRDGLGGLIGGNTSLCGFAKQGDSLSQAPAGWGVPGDPRVP